MEDDRKHSAEPAADPVWNPGPIEYAPGVTLYRYRDCDEYTGPPGDLIAAGLCREDQLPGAPGCGKNYCTYWPDGTRKRQPGRASPGTMKILKNRHQFMCRIVAQRTEQERQYWEQKDADRRAEYLRESAERAKAQNQDPAPPITRMDLDEHLRRLYSNSTDEDIDWMVESLRRSYDDALRISREVKAARRKEASGIASSDGVVIFPKRWQHA